MEMTAWYLRKHEDGTAFGPLSFEQLTDWAAVARIAPQDLVSNDQETWIKAPMVTELDMDWLVEITSERLYGPTTLGAIREFLRLGEIGGDSFVINTCNGARRRVRDVAPLFSSVQEEEENAYAAHGSPRAAEAPIDFAERIRQLEQRLEEERRALEEAEARCRDLEQRYQALLAATAPQR
jgi:hypothetical protein